MQKENWFFFSFPSACIGLETCFAWLAKKFGEAKMTKKREQSKRFYSTIVGKKRPERTKAYSPGHRPGDEIAKVERFHSFFAETE